MRDLHFLIMQTSGFMAEIPDELKADRLAELIQNSVFPADVTQLDSREGIMKQFDANLID